MARRRRPRGPERAPSSPRTPRDTRPRRRAPRDDAPVAVPRKPVERGAPLAGDWLWTTRPGSEQDLVDELALAGSSARIVAPALVRSRLAPTAKEGGIDLTFARQGFRIAGEIEGADGENLARRCAESLAPLLRDAPAWALSAWVPDADATNPLEGEAASLEHAVTTALRGDVALATTQTSLAALPRAGARLAQVALVARSHAYAGTVRTEDAPTFAPGGRARMRVGGERPSRAARKVEEALAWLGLAPGSGDVCVDLGAAPGGWSWMLLEKRAKVIAVDPAKLRPDVARHRSLVHRQESAFAYVPEEPVDWLFCDMAWRPLEVAQLLAKWGRNRRARFLVANLKLPMKKKAATVADLRAVVAGGGWQRVRTRQLYHDRDEVTLTAHL